MSQRMRRSRVVHQCCKPFGDYHALRKVFDVSESNVNRAKERGMNITTSKKFVLHAALVL